jgi:hypothetical protein
VARATLYFLLRYPGTVRDEARELHGERLAILLDWHRADPAGEHEWHRHMAIAGVNANRNPVVDHRDWAAPIDAAGMGCERPSSGAAGPSPKAVFDLASSVRPNRDDPRGTVAGPSGPCVHRQVGCKTTRCGARRAAVRLAFALPFESAIRASTGIRVSR